jgi:ankyrin repeat protein
MLRLRHAIEESAPALVYAKGVLKNRPLHVAAKNGHVECVEFLLAAVLSSKNQWLFNKERTPRADMQNEAGMSPIALAANGGHLAVVKHHLKAGANPDSIDNVGLTPLMRAAGGADTADRRLIAINLIRAGAQHLRKNKAGDTAYDIAISLGNYNMGQYLRSVPATLAGKTVLNPMELKGASRRAWETQVAVDAVLKTPVSELRKKGEYRSATNADGHTRFERASRGLASDGTIVPTAWQFDEL